MVRCIIQKIALLRKGYFPDTTEGLENETYCLVSLDADLYKPTLTGISYFYPRLVTGGYIFVHDFGTYAWGHGVKNAVREYCLEHSIPYVPILD